MDSPARTARRARPGGTGRRDSEAMSRTPDSARSAARAVPVPVRRFGRVVPGHDDPVDLVAVESALAVDVVHGAGSSRRRDRLMTTMRTPGQDIELAVGWLRTEGIIDCVEQVLAAGPCASAPPGEDVLRVELDPSVDVPIDAAVRRGTITSACGACGRPSSAARSAAGDGDGDVVASRSEASAGRSGPWLLEAILSAPDTLAAGQPGYRRTGGLHAAAFFDRSGSIAHVREDVGRHNAVDAVIGAALGAGDDPRDHALVVSSRAGLEIVQKASAVGVPIVTVVGAATSAAVQLAADSGVVLVGFVRQGRCVMYTGDPGVIHGGG